MNTVSTPLVAVPNRRLPPRFLLALFAVWWILSTLAYANLFHRLPPDITGAVPSWPENLLRAVVVNGLSAMIALGAFGLARRIPLRHDTWKSVTVIHVVAGVLLLIGRALIEYLISLHVPWMTAWPLQYRLVVTPLSFAHFYLLCVGTAYALVWADTYRDGVERAIRLQAQLWGAHLQQMKMQVHARMLLRPLDAVRALIRRDREAADGMISRFADTLRLVLDRIGAREVTLDEELAVLGSLLAIPPQQEARGLVEQISPEARRALVPHLLLAALLEGVLGTGQGEGTGAVAVIAEREGDWLRLHLEGKAPADPGAAERRAAVLEAARARLERSYPGHQELTVHEHPSGALQVGVRIPYRAATEISAAFELAPSEGADLQRFHTAASPARELDARALRTLLIGLAALTAMFQAAGMFFRFTGRGMPAAEVWEGAALFGAFEGTSLILTGVAALQLAQRMPLDSRRGRLLVVHAAAGVVLLLLLEGAVHLVSPWISVLSEMPFRTRLLTTTPVGALEYSLMMGFVYAIVYQRRLYLQDLDALRLQAERDRAELQVFKMQLQPHFLGNALNSITALIYRDPAAAEDALDRLQALLRQVLRNTAVQEVPLREELGFLRPYVELEQIRFGDRIQVEWRMDEEVLDAMVPHLILQPVVENAVKHALALRNAPGCLSIAAHAAGTVLRLEVCDSGSGSRSKRAGARGTGLGLSTSRLRLKRLYGDAYRLDVAVDPVAGSRVTIELPLRFAARDGTGAVDAPGGSRTPGPRPRL